jgi:hypothetical protein
LQRPVYKTQNIYATTSNLLQLYGKKIFLVNYPRIPANAWDLGISPTFPILYIASLSISGKRNLAMLAPKALHPEVTDRSEPDTSQILLIWLKIIEVPYRFNPVFSANPSGCNYMK